MRFIILSSAHTAHPGHAEEDAWTEGEDCCLHVREPGCEMMGGARAGAIKVNWRTWLTPLL